ncbi:MAG: glycoside hydrolase family 3 protein [Blastochloris sp.]|nr:glycoside hydrolase family 3 protein [Blastochloris sp.]
MKSASTLLSPGQLIIMGLPGPRLTDGLRSLITRLQPGGFILFNRNLESPAQIFELIAELHSLCAQRPVITIDQEGGRVSRLKAVGEEPPSGLELGRSGNPEWCHRHGVCTGQLLQALGFNLNLAPVVDYTLNEQADNSLRGRCYGQNPEQVIRLAGAFLEGMQSEGILGTAKHFPGYTHCEIDPHGELPRLTRSQEEIRREELTAFRAFVPRAECFMIGHGHFTAWHESPHPASLSRPIVTDLLKKELGYRGVIMTDDLEMGAIANRYGAAEATRLALEAGEELLLFCHNPACAEIALDQIQSMSEEITAPALESVARFKAKLPCPPACFDAAHFRQINEQIRILREEVRGELTTEDTGSTEGAWGKGRGAFHF